MICGLFDKSGRAAFRISRDGGRSPPHNQKHRAEVGPHRHDMSLPITKRIRHAISKWFRYTSEYFACANIHALLKPTE
jgi:hypothetical protein